MKENQIIFLYVYLQLKVSSQWNKQIGISKIWSRQRLADEICFKILLTTVICKCESYDFDIANVKDMILTKYKSLPSVIFNLHQKLYKKNKFFKVIRKEL